ncbi:TPA: Tn3 family transposase [Legionella pneumophila]
MPVSFLSPTQRDNYAKYPIDLPLDIVSNLFFLDDQDKEWISIKRGDFSRLGYALQLTTVRFIGTFISDLGEIPAVVIERVASQIKIDNPESCILMYMKSRQRWRHTIDIRSRYSYVEFSEKGGRFRLGRILCALCWTGTDRPGVLFDHAVDWLSTNKILLPGITILERFVAEIRSRMEARLWRMLIKNLTQSQQEKLSELLVVEDDEHQSLLDKLRKGPVGISSKALVKALKRVESARTISVKLPLYRIPACKIATLARFANTAKITAINRLPFERKMATLVAFATHFESNSQDDSLDVLSMLLRDLFSKAKQENKKTRLRTLKDLDQSAATLIDACKLLLDTGLSDHEVRNTIYATVGQDALIHAVENASSLIRPPNNVFYHELEQKEKTVQKFLPLLLRVINFESNPAGKPILASLEWLKGKQTNEPPMQIVGKSWKRNVVITDGCSMVNWPADEPRPTYRAMKKLLNNQDGIILHDNKLFYADLINRKITEIITPKKKQSHVEQLKKSILNMEEVQKNANDNELALITSLTARDSKKTTIDRIAYTFCVLDKLQSALKRRDVFISPSWRYADPRANLYSGLEWEVVRPMICRSLNLTTDPTPTLTNFADELDQTYRLVAANIDNNPAVRFETVKGNEELILTQLDALDEPPSLKALRTAVKAKLPRVDLPEMVLEIALRTGFIDGFTHINEGSARADDLLISLCAELLSEACNTGREPFVREDIPALKRDRLVWVDQNYIRNETIMAANAILVSAQNKIPLAQNWGGGDVASADGMRFVVPVRTVHAAPNPKYFKEGRGVTWYNLISNQRTGLNAVTVPGTLRDSLILLGVVLEQQTELQPMRIMTDAGAYSDIVFGLFRLLGLRFSPRLADIGGARFWRIDTLANYGKLNVLAKNRVNFELIPQEWDDILRLLASLKLGRVPSTGIMRTLQVGDKPTRLAKAIAEIGRIEKTIHMLNYLHDESFRRSTLIQLNLGEGRHSLGRAVFHGKRGELHQRYREGQEDQLGALGLVLNIITLWNTIYMDAAINQLRQEGFPVYDEDVARLSAYGFGHINMLGRYSFAMPDEVKRGELRPLRTGEKS